MTEIVMRVTVTTADTRDDAGARVVKEVERALSHPFGNAVEVEEVSAEAE